MICVKCEADTQVIDTRATQEGNCLRRRRKCVSCGHRFSTFESTTNPFKKPPSKQVWREQNPERERERNRKDARIRRAAEAMGVTPAQVRADWARG